MADSYRLAVLKALTVLLEGTVVTPVAGITLPATLDGAVFRGRSLYGVDAPATMLSMLESPKPGQTDYTYGDEARNEEWVILLQGHCPEDKRNPSDPIYSLLNDVEFRLDRINAVSANGSGNPAYPNDYLLGRLITSFRAQPAVVRPPTENISSKCFFYIPLTVGLARNPV